MPEAPSRHAEFHLGIVGGCMTHQRGVPLNALYHRRLAEVLARNHGIRLRTHVARAFEDDLAGRVERLLDESLVEGVLIHLRSAPIIWATQVVSRPWQNGRFKLRLNPMLQPGLTPSLRERALRAGGDEDVYGGAPDEQDRPPAGRRFVGFRIRDLNVAAGSLIGLDRTAIARQLRELGAAQRLAADRSVPIFAVGPTQVTYSSWTKRVVRRQERAVRDAAVASGLPLAMVGALTDAAGRPLIRADGTHLTVDGHAYVAARIAAAGLGSWMTGILERRADAR